MEFDQKMQQQLAMAGQIASKRVTYLLNRDFGFQEHRALVGCRLDTSGNHELKLFVYATTAGLFFRVTPKEDMSDIVLTLIPAGDEIVSSLKEFFGKLPESFTTVKPNTNRN